MIHIFTELWIGVKDDENGSLFYDTNNEKVGKWQSKISSRENLTEQGNLSRDIDNKTVRKEGISICLRTYNLLSKTQFICKQNGSS